MKYFKSNFYILVPRQKHCKNNIKIARFKKDKTTYKKERLFYKISFKNNIFIIKEISSIKDLKSINKYITKIELYAKITQYKRGSKKQLLKLAPMV